jgi:hypothetical protein
VRKLAVSSVARFSAMGEQGRSRAWRSGQAAAPLSAQAERNSSPIPHRGHRTCTGTEERAPLAGTFDNVVVAGQTRVHVITVRRAACRHRAINRATVVPSRPELSQARDGRVDLTTCADKCAWQERNWLPQGRLRTTLVAPRAHSYSFAEPSPNERIKDRLHVSHPRRAGDA